MSILSSISRVVEETAEGGMTIRRIGKVDEEVAGHILGEIGKLREAYPHVRVNTVNLVEDTTNAKQTRHMFPASRHAKEWGVDYAKESGDALATASRDGTLTFNVGRMSENLSKRARIGEGYPWSASFVKGTSRVDAITATTAHEFGHMMHFHGGRNFGAAMGWEIEGLSPTSVRTMNEIGALATSRRLGGLDDAAEMFPSQYSRTNHLESFAETFAFDRMGWGTEHHAKAVEGMAKMAGEWKVALADDIRGVTRAASYPDLADESWSQFWIDKMEAQKAAADRSKSTAARRGLKPRSASVSRLQRMKNASPNWHG